MHKRIHSSLCYLTPAEFESQWLAQYAKIEVLTKFLVFNFRGVQPGAAEVGAAYQGGCERGSDGQI